LPGCQTVLIFNAPYRTEPKDYLFDSFIKLLFKGRLSEMMLP
jgi:hypothetical protein